MVKTMFYFSSSIVSITKIAGVCNTVPGGLYHAADEKHTQCGNCMYDNRGI